MGCEVKFPIKQKQFLFKFIAMIVLLITDILWFLNKVTYNYGGYYTYTSAGYQLPYSNQSELVFFYFSVPAYTVILTGLVLLFIFFSETPGKWDTLVFSSIGMVFLIIAGIIGIIATTNLHRPPALHYVISILSIVAGVLLIVDFVFGFKNQGDAEVAV